MKAKAKAPPNNPELFFRDFLQLFTLENSEWLPDMEMMRKNGKAPADLEKYLRRDSRITTLQRQKYERQMQKFELSDVEEKLFSIQAKEDAPFQEIIYAISKKLTRPLLRQLNTPMDEYAMDIVSLALTEKLHISIIWDVEERIANTLIRRLFKKKKAEDKIIGIRIMEEGYPPLDVYGAKNTTHTSTNKNVRFLDGIICADLADVLSCITLHQQVNQMLMQLQLQKENHALYFEVKSTMAEYKKRILHNILLAACTKEQKMEYERELEANKPLPFLFPENMKLHPGFEKLSFAEKVSITCSNTLYYRKQSNASYIKSNSQTQEMTQLMFMEEYPLPYRMLLLHDGIGRLWGLPDCFHPGRRKYQTDIVRVYNQLFYLLLKEKFHIKNTRDYYRELSGDYAKSFMLKKRISVRVSEAMQTSLFNQYFGFVEFDDETDVTKAEEVAKEFAALWETYLTGIDSTKHVIRFRKLGHHKAIGLYYPAFGCLCVDYRAPHSLVHEYGHLIDFSCEQLSAAADFYVIRIAYKERLERNMDENEALSARMKGKTKYNMAYYLTPTEIFARCFELYVALHLKVRSSIVPETFQKEVYPQDEIFLNMVVKYFDRLLSDKERLKKISADITV